MADKKKIKEAKDLIIAVMDKLDKSGTNAQRYAEMFAGMSDEEFLKMAKRRLPYRLEQNLFKVEPSMSDIFEAFKVLNKPLMEKVRCPYLHTRADGIPIETKEAMVVYVHLKRMKQMIVEKTSTASHIEKRDMAGMLIGDNKGGKQSDREFESLAALNLYDTMDEFARPRADAMRAKTQMYNTIANQGYVTKKDITVDKDDSLAKNMMNVYLLAANIKSNLVDDDYITPYTRKHGTSK